MANTNSTIAVTQPSKQVRFNWGFWDGVNAKRSSTSPLWTRSGGVHFDKTYVAGYWAGRAVAGTDVQSSDAAWREYASA